MTYKDKGSYESSPPCIYLIIRICNSAEGGKKDICPSSSFNFRHRGGKEKGEKTSGGKGGGKGHMHELSVLFSASEAKIPKRKWE